jgi:hypothetical protein
VSKPQSSDDNAALERRLPEVLRQRSYSYEHALEEHRLTDRYDELMALDDEELAELYAQEGRSLPEATQLPVNLVETSAPERRSSRPRVNWLPAVSTLVAASLVVAVFIRTRNDVPGLDHAHLVKHTPGTESTDDAPDLDQVPFALPATGTGGTVQGRGAIKPQAIPLLALAPSRASSLSTHPHFWWQGAPGNYRLQVKDVATGTNIAQVTTLGTDAIFPSELPPLKRGREYVWSVQPLTATGGVAPDAPVTGATMVVLSQERSGNLQGQLDSRSAEERLLILAKAAIWYDTFALVETEYTNQPSNPTWQRRREQLHTYLQSLSQKVL